MSNFKTLLKEKTLYFYYLRDYPFACGYISQYPCRDCVEKIRKIVIHRRENYGELGVQSESFYLKIASIPLLSPTLRILAQLEKNRIPPHGIAIAVRCHRKSSFELEHRIARIGEFFCVAHAFSVLCIKVRKGLSRKIGNTRNDIGYSYTAIVEL